MIPEIIYIILVLLPLFALIAAIHKQYLRVKVYLTAIIPISLWLILANPKSIEIEVDIHKSPIPNEYYVTYNGKNIPIPDATNNTQKVKVITRKSGWHGGLYWTEKVTFKAIR
jgi:hypothetical protein